jgi:hypothetical protein
MLRFDDVIRLCVPDLSFEENSTGKFIRVKLKGGKTIMMQARNKNDRIITYTGNESCLYTLTER